MSMVGCGAKKGHGFRGPLGCQSVWSPHAVNMIMVERKNDHARDSRMARALRARVRESERTGTASAGVSVASNHGTRAEEGGPSNEEVSVRCETCSREFRNKRGLGVHIAHAHPEEANSAVDIERVKARWPVEEIRLMARAEVAAIARGVQFMNLHLRELFPHRSLEAIKGKRRQDAYREMVRDFGLEAQPSPAVAVIGNGSRNDSRSAATPTGVAGATALRTNHDNNHQAQESPPPQVADRLRDTIRHIVERNAAISSFESETLLNIGRAALAIGEVDVPAIERWLGRIFPAPTVHPPQRSSKRRRSPPERLENRKQRRKREFAHVQTLYKKNLRTCLSHILDGSSKRKRPSSAAFGEYWRPVMEAPSVANGVMTGLRELYGESKQVAHAGQSLPSGARGIHLEGLGEGAAKDRLTSDDHNLVDRTLLWDPITPVEIKRISVRTGTAPGLDGITPGMWNAVPIILRTLLFNLLLLAEMVPVSTATTRTIFLEKGGMSDEPSPAEYRPLSIGSVIIRQLHKILARRLTSLDIFDLRQRGFRPVDGVCENVTVLSAVLGDARRRCRSLHLACVDVSKAFDTVSHKAIHSTLEELGLPREFRNYIKNLYDNARTVLQTSESELSEIHIGRGVRQGDPLSPLLFNLVVDRALGVLSEDVGYRMGGRVIGALGYADDIVLLSSTKVGLQENLNRLHEAFLQNGLSINSKKTGVLSVVASGRDKKVKIDMEPTFTVGGAVIPQRSPTEIWTYLGCMFQGAKECMNIPPLARSIELLTKAPLKPQQRLRLLRDGLLPRYYYRWVVGAVTSKTLRGVDVQIRTAIRRWLRLPHDVPAGYYHAPIKNGGLGLPLMRTLIPILKRNRLLRLCKSTLPAACAAAESTYVARQLVWCENQMRVCGEAVSSTAELRRQCASWLRGSCDGRGLGEVVSSKLSSHWVSAGADAIPGADYVHYHHVRINCLPSRMRVSRGRDRRDVRCRAGCPDIETPAHCVQRCFRTHGGRILRHNNLCRQVGGFLRQKGWRVDEELSYSTREGRRRPDLTIAKGSDAVIIDAQVVSGETALSLAHERKVDKYRSCEDLADRVAEHTGVARDKVRFTAITISWRGVWCPESEREMRSLGLTTGQLRTLTTRVLWGSWMNWRRFNGITTTYDAWPNRVRRNRER